MAMNTKVTGFLTKQRNVQKERELIQEQRNNEHRKEVETGTRSCGKN
jgi:hypothetical protein